MSDVVYYAISLNRIFLRYLGGRFNMIKPWAVSHQIKFCTNQCDVEMWNFDIDLCMPLDKHLNPVVKVKKEIQIVLF